MKGNRIIFGWIVLLMGLLCSVKVGATDVDSEQGLRDAINRGDSYIRLTKTIELKQTITVSQGNITLDLAGCSIYNGSYKQIWTKYYEIDIFDITGGTLVIQGTGSIANRETEEHSTIWVNGGNLELRGGTISKDSPAGGWGSGVPAVVVENGGTFKMFGGAISSHKATWYSYGLRIKSGSFLMEGGEIKTTKSASAMTAIALDIQGGQISLKKGTISSADRAISSIYNWGQILLVGYGIYKDGSLQSSSGTTVDGTIEIKPISYTIKYSGVDPEREGSYDVTQGTVSLSEEIKRGYDFDGWFDKVGKVTAITYANVSSHSDQYVYTLTAQWTIHNYTITYYSEGKEITSVGSNPKIYKIGNNAALQPISKGDAEFIGWKDRGTGQIITNLPGNDPRDLQLDAVWDKKYNITFVTGTDESIPEISTTTSKEVTIPTPKEKKGYTFDCWSDGKGNTIHDKISANIYESDIILTAVWIPVTYRVTFKDGEDTKDTKEYTIESGLSGFPTIRKDGYVFNSWLNENKQPVSSISEGTIGDKIFTADWTEITYTLTYDYVDGKTPSSSDTYKYTETGQTQIRSASRKGYNFLGWFLPGSTDKLEKVPTPISDTQKEFLLTATAKWEIQNYKVIFCLNDGTGAALSEKEYTYNVNTGILEKDMPKDIKRTGYDFGGWFGNEACTGDKIENVSAGAGELKLYAKWIPKTYTITYDMQGGTNASNAPSSFIYNEGCLLPSENVKRDHYVFTGWTTEATSTTYVKSIPANTEGNQKFYAQWTPCVYTISYVTNTETTLPAQSYLYGTEVKTKKTYKEGYRLTWCYDTALTRPFGDLITSDKILVGTGDVLTLYAKWTPVEYTIKYNSYYGEIASGKIEKYTIEREVTLPTDVRREGFSFAGWYADDLLKEKITKIEKGSYGDKTVYATWDRGYQVIVSQPSNGKIAVTHNGNAVASGAMVGKGESLVVTATPTTSDYVLKQLTVNGTTYTTSPQTVVMPEKDLKITAEFTISSVPAAPAPKIILSPAGVDKFPKEENVKVQLEKTDESTTLYYRLDGSPEKAYSGEFLVESAKDTVLLEAIAKKDGYRDGVTTRYIIFDNGKITLTFDLPLGVKAINPTGGDVVTATTTGGSFEFKLTVDKNYYTNLDSMVVSANDSTITGNASGLYTLTNCSSDITVTVSGLKAKTCTVTLQQTENGQIKFTDGADETTSEVGYGSSVSITAVADEDFKFLQWNTGSQSNPLNLTVSRDTTISARFISDYKSYMMTLPQMEGVTVKPFSGFSTEVKKDGTFKFYLVLAKGYREGNLVVRANGEELTKNKGGYAIYHINKNISISVDGIVRDSIKLTLPDHVTAKVVETMSDVAGQGLFEETMLLLQAKAPEGKIFSKWTDGKTDNPRMATAVDAAQLIPLFVDKEDATYAKVILNQSPGAGITGANSNMDAVKSGDVVQLKVVLLPAYSQSEVVLTADDKVLTPETSLRAASETKTYVYNLPVEKDGITVKVSGLKLNSYEVTVSQTNGGTVSAVPAGKVTHGDKVQLKAEAASGMLFVKWWDGNTLNPYPYTVTSDTEVKACFVGTESIVDNELVDTERVRMKVSASTLFIEVPETSQLYIWDYKGSLFRTLTVSAGMHTCSLPSGAYLVKVGDGQPVKVVVR